ncbi:hypothetical protein BDV93DRAFT_484703 [Ceratobasidium sp. AG-I]|nr:hypothetical protein BDV93DRAFT_484703 [Ceratobasidium sp. AG-I]
MSGSGSFADRVARACIDVYGRHPEFHPTARSNGAAQFTILSGVVLARKWNKGGSFGDDLELRCIALGAGSKCLPANRLPKLGEALHDSHAEVLARRAAIRWLYQEIIHIVNEGAASPWIKRCEEAPAQWRLNEGVEVWMYVSTLPCGDASTTALAINQPAEMASLKALSPMPAPVKGTTARGRDNYNALGWLRTKPARADAPPTISHACSDKIALWSLVGFQGALLFQLMGNLFFSGVILGDVLGQFSEADTKTVLSDCQRALITRLRPLPEGINTPPEISVLFTQIAFPHARSQAPFPTVVSDPESHVWIDSNTASSSASEGVSETIVNGLRRGVGPKRKDNPRFQPLVCKASMMRLHSDARVVLGLIREHSVTYYELKHAEEAKEYHGIKTTLRATDAPLQGWLVSGREWEDFGANDGD